MRMKEMSKTGLEGGSPRLTYVKRVNKMKTVRIKWLITGFSN
jgi:hypothetical protein